MRVATWLDSVGKSSANFASACLSSSGKVFATASRKFVRVDESGRPTGWTDTQLRALEAVRRTDEDSSHALQSSGGTVPAIERLSPPATETMATAVPMMRAVALPSRFGSGGHLDHAALLEWAHDAHVLHHGPSVEDDAKPLSACIAYLGQARLGDEVEVLRADAGGARQGPLLVTRRVADGAMLTIARIQ